MEGITAEIRKFVEMWTGVIPERIIDFFVNADGQFVIEIPASDFAEVAESIYDMYSVEENESDYAVLTNTEGDVITYDISESRIAINDTVVIKRGE